MFKQLTAIEPLNLTPEGEARLSDYTEHIRFYYDIPKNNEQIIKRIGESDAILLSWTSHIDKEVLKTCPKLKYIGMCCSLYAPENANVDILTAKEMGIEVKGVRDYGDEGVPEYVISELVRILHGFGDVRWKQVPMELTNVKIGIMGLGTSGTMVAKALKFFGADVYYYSRTRKKEIEETEDITYLSKNELLSKVDILCTCLNKNVILMDQEAFERFGNGKIFINTSIGPSHETEALKEWLCNKGNFALSDTAAGLGGEEFLKLPNVICVNQTAGKTSLSKVRLTEKVIQNIEDYLKKG